MTKPKKPDEKAETPLERFKADPDSMAAIVTHMAGGGSLASFCRDRELAYMTVQDWIAADDARAVNYARAKEARADFHFETLGDVSDAAEGAQTAVEVAGLRLKADNIKWQLARMSGRYGDKLELAGGLTLKKSAADMTDEELAAIAAGRRAEKIGSA